ncbi:unnamed protein product [Didymodactylos carnosus]|uniref:Uncharacterized protein n=1 Tax=Didymodactylos carnosus TaxID=1234261 RepID=A0A815C9Q1_9BILA|nr:unnamed protein product [Didymodactylos carnosus]CAF4082646.1 unnamed protein product [Didymodactylos carnosus]
MMFRTVKPESLLAHPLATHERNALIFTAQGKPTSIYTIPEDNWQHSNTMKTSAYTDDKKPLSKDIETTADNLKFEQVCYLNLTGKLASKEDKTAITEALKINKTLTTLLIARNNTSDQGAMAIAEALKINKTLRTLDIIHNNISDQGAMAIAEALKINKTLTTLSISENNISNQGGMAIAEALKINKTLTTLSVYRNNTSKEKIEGIKRAWNKRSLDLYC